MIRNNYYCLVAGLPEIFLDQGKIPVSISDLKSELEESLSASDYNSISFLFLPLDNENLLNILVHQKEDFNALGNYSLDEISANLREPETLPPYMKDFIIAFNDGSPLYTALSWDNQLTAKFHEHVENNAGRFIKEWYAHDLLLKNITSAVNCREYNIDREKEIIGKGEITDALKNSNARDFGLIGDIVFIEKLVQVFETGNVLDKEKFIDQNKWSFLDEKTEFEYFSLEKVMAYTIKLMIVERWMKLDEETGRELLQQLISELQDSYEFSKEFSLK